MGQKFYGFMLGGGLKSILEDISEILNTDGEVVSWCNGGDHTECRISKNQGGGIIKLLSLYLRSTISTTKISIEVDVVSYVLDVRVWDWMEYTVSSQNVIMGKSSS